MRLQLHSLFPLLLAATLVNSGCSNSSSRRRVGVPFASRQPAPSLKQYDTDPPAEKPRHSDPVGPQSPVPPAPPARGVSHVMGVGFSRMLGYAKRSTTCAPEPHCAAPAGVACGSDTCGATESSIDRRPALLRCWWHKKQESTCCAPGPSECASQPTCSAPARGTYCPQGCDEPRVQQPRCHVPTRQYCPPQKAACVPQYRSTDQYCAPARPSTCVPAECGQSGYPCQKDLCNRGPRPSLFATLFGCGDRQQPQQCGVPCAQPAPCGQPPVFDGCADQQQPYSENAGNQPTPVYQQNGGATSAPAYSYQVVPNSPAEPSEPDAPRKNPYEPGSPLKDRQADRPRQSVPAVPKPPAAPKAPQSNMPQQPNGLGAPQSVDDVPGTPMPGTDRELAPMPQPQAWNQPWVEPSAWPRLQTPSLATENDGLNHYHPSSWRR